MTESRGLTLAIQLATLLVLVAIGIELMQLGDSLRTIEAKVDQGNSYSLQVCRSVPDQVLGFAACPPADAR